MNEAEFFLLIFGCRVQFLLLVMVVKTVAERKRGMDLEGIFVAVVEVNLIRAPHSHKPIHKLRTDVG